MVNGSGALALVNKIKERIAAAPEQAISFRDFMDMCLYDAQDGYYMNDKPKIGKEGDFYTSASIGDVFGEVVGRFIVRSFQASMGPVHYVEWGGGDGRLARLVLHAIKRLDPAVYERLSCTMVETSGFHRSLQQSALAEHTGKAHFLSPEEWRKIKLTEPAVIMANELLDAFPVHRITQTGQGIREIYVQWNEVEEAFTEALMPISNERLSAYADQYAPNLGLGQIAEVNLAAEDWVREELERIEAGTLLVVDYGDSAQELYSAHRWKGTLMCYRNHVAQDNPYVHIGEQDITAHVNFTSCLDAAAQIGRVDQQWMTQKQFLLDNGILELLMEHAGTDPFSTAAKRNRSVRQLLLSDQMSELFKVCMLTKKGGL